MNQQRNTKKANRRKLWFHSCEELIQELAKIEQAEREGKLVTVGGSTITWSSILGFMCITNGPPLSIFAFPRRLSFEFPLLFTTTTTCEAAADDDDDAAPLPGGGGG